ncbi:MAG TPA: hypothetical protein VMH84_14195 [Xanthobacteraceae bacterium]|nr:hypothetical protein [Xanthobacteraceae bacterium]
MQVAAQSAADLLRKHGLIGTRAMDCAKPPGNGNPYLIYRIEPDGTVKSDLVVTGSKVVASTTVLSVEETESNMLRITQTASADPGVRVEFDLRLEGNRSRSFRSVSSDGHTFIEAGRMTSNNKETVWLTRCGSGS